MVQLEIDADGTITLPAEILNHLDVAGEEAELALEFLEDKKIRLQKLAIPKSPKRL